MSAATCVDLFCGAGGLSHGLIQEGLKVTAGIDIDPACRYAFEENNKANFYLEDVSSVTSSSLRRMFGGGEIRVLAGCAPCQPFSTYAQRYETIESSRWSLLYQFSRLIDEVAPEVVTMENVPLVQRHKVFQDFIESLKRKGYNASNRIIDCTEYGLPQSRRRMVVLASRIGEIDFPKPEAMATKTVRDAISHLAVISHGEKSNDDPLHVSSRLSKLNMDRIRASKPGGTWRDWPRELVADCHTRDSGRTYSGVYGRMAWDSPSPTITTQFYGFGNGRFGHPSQDRALSLREGAILQGFPDDYSFLAPDSKVVFKDLGRMIGNAVPVTLGRLIGKAITAHLDSHLGHKVDVDSKEIELLA